jgi:20S proteasome subunit alpha 7
MSWISGKDGPTKGRHEEVPRKILEEAEELAKKALESDDEEETAAEGDDEKMSED